MTMKKILIGIGLCVAVIAAIIWFFLGVPNLGKLSEVLPGSYEREVHRLKSPDQQFEAVFWHKEKHGMMSPAGSAKTLARWSRVAISSAGQTIYDSSYENLNIYQNSFGLDAAWSPDSKCLAYRHADKLRTIDSGGKAVDHDVLPAGSIISSFRWVDGESLVIVSKKLELPSSGDDAPYPSYCEKAVDVRITRLSLAKGKNELHVQPLEPTTFLFHALDFLLEEISPAANRVAFSDGPNLCIYDAVANKVIAKVVIPQKTPVVPGKAEDYSPEILESIKDISAQRQELEGLWWKSDDELIMGVGLLGSYSRSFYKYDMPSGQLTEVTNILLPIWDGSDEAKNYKNSDWYRAAIR